MAETYKGLTIKFGGDTTNLQKALTNVTKTARLADSELRRVNQAMRLDPSGIQAAALKFDLLETKSTQANAKLSLLDQTMKELSQRRPELASTSIGKLVEEAERGRYEYNQLNSAIAETKNEIAALEGVRFPTEDVDKFLMGLDQTNPKMKELVQQYYTLTAARKNFDTDLMFGDAEKMANLRTEIQKTTAEAEKYSREMKQMAAENAGIDRIGENFVKIKNDIKEADLSADHLESELQKLNNALQLDPSNVEAAAIKIDNMKNQASLAENKIESLTAQMKQISIALDNKSSSEIRKIADSAKVAEQNFDKVSVAVREAKADITNMKNEAIKLKTSKGELSQPYVDLKAKIKEAEERLSSLVIEQERAKAQFQNAELAKEYRELNTELTETKAKLNSVSNELSSANGKFNMSTSSLTTLGLAFYSTVTPAVTMAGDRIIESAETIDGAFRDMKKTVEGTEEQFQQLKEAAIEYSNTHITSADQILEIEAMGGQLGIVVDELETFAEVVSNLDIATNMETETIAESLGSLSNIMHMSEEDFTRFGDSLVRLGNNMPTQESKIMDITTRIGSFGSIVGMTAPQILAWSTAIAATGQKAESAGTAISTTMSDIETVVATGGEALERFASVAGKSADEFAKTWKENPSRAMQDFVEGLKRIHDEGGSVDATLQDLEITGVRQKMALEGLVQTVDVLDDALTMSQNAWDGVSDQWGKAGDAAREAQQKSEGFSGAIGILRNIANNFASEAGESLTGVLNVLGDALLVVTEGFEKLPEGMQTFITLAVGSTAAFGPLLTMFAGAKTAIGQVDKALTKQSSAWLASVKGVEEYRDAVMAGIAPTRYMAEETDKSAKRQKRLYVTAKASAAAMSALKAAVGGLAIVMVAKLVTAIGDYLKTQEQFKKATTDLRSSVFSLGDAVTNTSDKIKHANDSVGTSFDTIFAANDKMKEVISSQDELAESMKTAADEVGGKIGIVEAYKDELFSLAGKTKLTDDEFAKLKSDVDIVNESLGQHLTVVRNSDGSYKIMQDGVEVTIEKLKELIQNTELAMKAEYYRQQQTALFNSGQDLNKSLDQAKQNQEEFGKIFQATMGYGVETSAVVGMTNQAYAEQTKKLEEMKSANDEAASSAKTAQEFFNKYATATEDSMGKAVAQAGDFADAIFNAGHNADTFATQLGNLGVSTDQFRSLQEEDLDALVAAYDGTEGSIAVALQGIGAEWTNTSAIENAALAKMRQDLVDFGLSSESVANLSKENIDALKNVFSTLAVETGGNVNKLIEKMKEFGITEQQIASLTPEQINTIIAAYQSGQYSFYEIMQAIHDGTVSKLGTAGTDGGQAYADGIGSKSGDAKSAGETVAESGKDGLESVDTSQSGQNFVNGFIGGINSLIGDVFTKGLEVAQNALAGLREGQKEGSPSKLTRKSGKFFVMGYAMEIERNTDLAVVAARNLGKATADALQAEASGIDATFAVSTEHGYGAARAGNVYNDSKETINVYIDGAIVNDDKQIGIVLKDTLMEYKRKSEM